MSIGRDSIFCCFEVKDLGFYAAKRGMNFREFLSHIKNVFIANGLHGDFEGGRAYICFNKHNFWGTDIENQEFISLNPMSISDLDSLVTGMLDGIWTRETIIGSLFDKRHINLIGKDKMPEESINKTIMIPLEKSQITENDLKKICAIFSIKYLNLTLNFSEKFLKFSIGNRSVWTGDIEFSDETTVSSEMNAQDLENLLADLFYKHFGEKYNRCIICDKMKPRSDLSSEFVCCECKNTIGVENPDISVFMALKKLEKMAEKGEFKKLMIPKKKTPEPWHGRIYSIINKGQCKLSVKDI